jgi:very-short-patch-repair endonuclease
LQPIDESAPIEITTVLECTPTIPGVRAHRSGILDDHDVEVVDGIPTSSAARLIIDLSGRMGPVGLGRLADDAVRAGQTSPGAIVQRLERLPWAPGRSPNTVREMLAARLPEFGSRESRLEEFVFDSLRRYGLPVPKAQVWVQLPGGPRRLDSCYADDLLVLESDGFEFHSGRGSFDDDRRRNNELVVAGFRVLHFTSAFTDHEIACTVAAALALAPPACASEGPQSFKQWCGVPRVVPCSAPRSGG